MHDPRDPNPPPRTIYVPRTGEPYVPAEPPPEPFQPRRRWGLAIGLFVATCLSTFLMGGPLYAAAVVTILTCHELGHFVQAHRYRVEASLPYFIPLPLPPLGTLGAVIAMGGRIPNRRALFDIGISGPLAGLPPAILFAVIGIQRSEVRILEDEVGVWFGEPLLFQFLTRMIHGEIPEGYALFIGPLGLAGWVGIFITALNLIPIGQLDGGHVLYALLGRRRAHPVAIALLGAAVVAVIAFRYWHWSLLLALLVFFGARHPPTGDDSVRLGPGRRLLGWLTLGFIILGFTPVPWSVGLPTP